MPDSSSSPPADRELLLALAQARPSRVVTAAELADLELLSWGLAWPVRWESPPPPGAALRNARFELIGLVDDAGRPERLDLPPATDRAEPPLAPTEVGARLAALGRDHVLAWFPTRPLWESDVARLGELAAAHAASLLLLPLDGATEPDRLTRWRALQAVADSLPPTVVAALPAASGLARLEAQARVAHHLGASHLLVEPSSRAAVAESGPALPLTLLAAPTPPLAWEAVRRDWLDPGLPLPASLARPALAQVLRDACPPRHRRGLCLWFTGLPSSGKSTLADRLVPRLRAAGRTVTLLDGDVVRTHLSRGLGFSKEDRDANILRIGFVAAEIVRHHGTVVCAAVSPYRATREQVRAMVGAEQFVEIFVDTPLAECERRDVKGLYAQARAGRIQGFTGIDDPYEPPAAPELRLETVGCDAAANVALMLEWLRSQGRLAAAGEGL